MSLLDRIANYFKEWDGVDSTAPTMKLNIDEYEPKYQHQERPNEDYFECLNDYLDGIMNV